MYCFGKSRNPIKVSTYISFKITLNDEVCFARLGSIRCNISAIYIFYLELFIIHLKTIYLNFLVKKAK